MGTSVDGWSFLRYLDQRKEEAKGGDEAGQGGVAAARALFKSKTVRGNEGKPESEGVWTQHESAITGLCAASPAAGKAGTSSSCSTVASCALDGRIVVWNLPSLLVDVGLASLSIT